MEVAKKNVAIGSRISAVIILLMLFRYWKDIYLVFSTLTDIHVSCYITWLLLCPILNIAAAIGLLIVRKWGFWCSYAAIFFSTLFIGSSYIPISPIIKTAGITLPPTFAFLPAFVVNALFILYIGYLHRNYLKSST